MQHHVLVCPARATGDDRACVFGTETWVVACIADGAGGTGGGGGAADRVMDAVQALKGEHAPSANVLVPLLERLDEELAPTGGETTAALVVVSGTWVCGASVGDTEVFVSRGGALEAVNASQRRKPLLGSGRAVITPFRAVVPPGARLLMASDGICKFVPGSVVERVVREAPLAVVAARLVEAATLPTGRLVDDVAVVVLETPR